jgi:Zn-dependent protease
MNFSQENILWLLCSIPAVVAGLTVHEFAHAYAAHKLGDDTAKNQGRLTLDPIAHLDLFGSLFFIIAMLSGFGIGWAKPVPVNRRNLSNPRRDDAIIAVAGPISNILQVPIWMAFIFAFGFIANKFNIDASTASSVGNLLGQALLLGVVINVTLAAFNMIPFPPLDGHWILQSIGGRPIEELFDAIRPYSFIALILLINFTPIISYTIGPLRNFAQSIAVQTLQAGINLGG